MLSSENVLGRRYPTAETRTVTNGSMLRCTVHKEINAHNLQLDNFAIQLHRSYFLHTPIMIKANTSHILQPRTVRDARNPRRLCLCSFLCKCRPAQGLTYNAILEGDPRNIACKYKHADYYCAAAMRIRAWHAVFASSQRTAKRSSRHDFPTPESPIRSS